jgi:hypothetical protein
MRYVARIFKVGSDTYIFNDRIYHSFLEARRDMAEACRIIRENNQKNAHRSHSAESGRPT